MDSCTPISLAGYTNIYGRERSAACSGRVSACSASAKKLASDFQVNTNWDWGHVHQADTYLEHLERMRDANVTSDQ